MTDRSPRDIEQEIEAERSALEQSIEALQAQFSADAIIEQASGFLKTHGAEVAQSLARTARDNPGAVALTGVGLAWLLTARNDVGRAGQKVRAAYDTRSVPTAGGFRSERPAMAGFDERIAAAEAAMDESAEPDPAIAGGRAHHLKESDEMSDEFHGSRASVEAGGTDAKSRAYIKAAELRRRIDEGTSEMSEAARARVRQAREAAVAAQDAVERRARETARVVRRTSHDNPLLVGALTFAAGAVLAASLPRTSTENRAVGGHRDRLFDEADRVFREEAEKMKAVAKSAVEEGKVAAKDALSDSAATPDAGAAVSRVSRAAKAEAKRQGVGRIG